MLWLRLWLLRWSLQLRCRRARSICGFCPCGGMLARTAWQYLLAATRVRPRTQSKSCASFPLCLNVSPTQCLSPGCHAMHGPKAKQSFFESPPGSADASLVGKSLVISLHIDVHSAVSEAARKAPGSSSNSISGWQLLPDIVLDWGSGALVRRSLFVQLKIVTLSSCTLHGIPTPTRLTAGDGGH